MINSLQKKFIKTSMAAISLLLIVLFVSLNIFNFCTVISRQNDVINMLIKKDQFDIPGLKRQRIFSVPVNENTKFSSAYFEIMTDINGEILMIDVSRIATVTEEKAKNILSEIDLTDKPSGMVSGYKYSSERNEFGTRVVFIDITESKYEIIKVIEISALLICICWILMFMLIIALSKKAIKPIAENFDKQKQFVTDAGHEIKTPLAIIMANTEALELFNGETKWSKNIKEQVNRLNGLMQNLLTLAKVDENNNIVLEKINFSEITKNTADMFVESAKLKDIIIDEEIDDIDVVGNKEQLTNLVSILIDNALKYGVKGENIKVSLHKDDGRALLKVVNKCEKLPDTTPDKLFDRFYRGDSSRCQGVKGYGIGLAAASAICCLHKGSIHAEYVDEKTIAFIAKI